MEESSARDAESLQGATMKVRYISLRGGHPTSQLSAKAVNAESITIKTTKENFKFIITFRTQLLFAIISMFFKALFTKKQNETAYLCEGIPNVIFPLFMRMFKHEKNYIIIRANDESFDLRHKSVSAKRFYKALYKHINGIVAISTLVADDARKHVHCPIKISHTFLWRDYAAFKKIQPDFRQKNFIFIGEYRAHKGVDILAKAMKRVLAETHSKMYLVGPGIEEGLEKEGLLDERFICVGYKTPADYFNRVQFNAHTARYEAGGAAIIECMAAGIIPFVSEFTGNKDLVKQVSSGLVLRSMEPDKISSQILSFLNSHSIKELEILSKKAKIVAFKNDMKHGTDNFKKAFAGIIKEVRR
jgi:glycosyltransferase involved in cell wall biosynthesis